MEINNNKINNNLFTQQPLPPLLFFALFLFSIIKTRKKVKTRTRRGKNNRGGARETKNRGIRKDFKKRIKKVHMEVVFQEEASGLLVLLVLLVLV